LVSKIKEKIESAVKDIINGIEKEAKEKKECPCCNRKFDEEKPKEEIPTGVEADKPEEENDDSLNVSLSDFNKD
jgi:hypothetical protein